MAALQPMDDDDEHYASSEDSDFAPDRAPEPVSSAESDDDDDDNAAASTATGAKRKRGSNKTKTKTSDGEAEDVGFDNSGDEAVISRGKKKQRRQRQQDGDDDNNDDGNAGGFVKTRSQRANEKAERRVAVVQGPVTVDVDALWAQMTGTGAPASAPQLSNELSSSVAAAVAAASSASAAEVAAGAGDGNGRDAAEQPPSKASKSKSRPKPKVVTIRRTYNFAGKVHTEEKRVARDSAEAKLYFAETGQELPPGNEEEGGDEEEGDDDNEDGSDNEEGSNYADEHANRPPPRQAFRSAFEPVLDMSQLLPGGSGTATAARRADLDLGLRARLLAREQQQQQLLLQKRAQAKKLNTVEKSRMDWAGFVDREGIQDELVLAGKAKGAFADRQQFLARTDMLRDEEARRARLAGKT